jgi:glycosyltransferase involved in cell wall biosynthesis
MGYRLADLELTAPPEPITLSPEQTGLGLVVRCEGRLLGFRMLPLPPGATLSPERLKALCDEAFAPALAALRARDALEARWGMPQDRPAPTLSIAICTKDRAQRLARLLASLAPIRHGSELASVEVLVVDNAPSDESTRQAVAGHPGVRYVRELKAGLDFARNAALHAATGELLAFLDDDVVVDRGWLDGLLRAWRACPDAGGFTGLVLPFRLDTEAQIAFERGGGFGRGFAPVEHRAERHGNRLHPVGAGVLGAGCNMCFDRRLLLELGGFDEALDTGAPLPGGGDLDIFYRVLRAGRTMRYEPAYAVYHEHRETIPQLTRQYWTWGLGFMAYLAKSWRTDPPMRSRQRAMVWWWGLDRLGAIGRAALRGRWQAMGFAWAEFKGGVQGAFGEYDRSQARVRRIRERAA